MAFAVVNAVHLSGAEVRPVSPEAIDASEAALAERLLTLQGAHDTFLARAARLLASHQPRLFGCLVETLQEAPSEPPDAVPLTPGEEGAPFPVMATVISALDQQGRSSVSPAVQPCVQLTRRASRRSPPTLAARLGDNPVVRDTDAIPLDALGAGPHLDALVAERVMGEARPAGTHDHAHIEPLASPGGNWRCDPCYERGDVCEWVPLPFSTAISAAWRLVERLEPLVSRFQSADGFVHLASGHWADHGDCLGPESTVQDEEADLDPQPWSFHIHLGLLSANPDVPAHWTHSERFCARASTAPLAICLAALKSTRATSRDRSTKSAPAAAEAGREIVGRPEPVNVTLRFPEPRDVAPLFAAVRESFHELHPWAPWCPLDYGLDDAARWVGQQPAAREAGTAFEFVILDDDGSILGCCGVNQVNAGFRLGNLGYWVRSSATRRGVATAAARRTADWAFRSTALQRLELLVAVENLASQAVAVKAGATLEGRLRCRFLVHGQFQDAFVYSIIRPAPPPCSTTEAAPRLPTPAS